MPSLELTRYLHLRAAGSSVEDAAADSRIGIGEARLCEKAIERGELQLPNPSTKESIMARKAKQESEEQQAIEIQKPDFERAIKVLEHDVHPEQEKNAKARGELSAAWKIIEDDCHVNKKAAKLYFQMTGMSDEKRDDFLRSLYGLMDAGGMGISADLVDRMEADGEAPRMPVAEPSARDGLATLQPELTH